MLVRAPWSRGLEIPLESTIHLTVFSSLQNDTDLPKFGAVRRQVCEVTARLTASSTWRPERGPPGAGVPVASRGARGPRGRARGVQGWELTASRWESEQGGRR